MYNQLVTSIQNPLAAAFTYDYWATGGDLNTIENLHKELLQRLKLDDGDIGSHTQSRAYLDEIAQFTKVNNSIAGTNSVWDMTLPERTRLLEKWEAFIDRKETTARLCDIHGQHKRILQAKRSVRAEREISVMQEASVVGMTTTACAARRDQLIKVGFEILICEEAGEVLEAHALCTMLPTLKHAISIGDPLQLRPEAEEQSLVMETHQGRQYRLNESLFERIMQPLDPMSRVVPTARLHIQRRMHPSISDISRITYPYLQDHTDTWAHPIPKGLRQRVLWLDHNIPEDETNDVSKSVSNGHEVVLVKELVRYLLRGSDYSPGDIAVLTPYSGQLLKLRAALSDVCAIYLGEDDRDALVESGALEADHDELIERGRIRMPMHSLLRLATIDNFQGEEAKVIILSTVRSSNKLGFVKSPNRINVAMSRARDGLYVFGNSNALRADPIWNAIINMFVLKQALQSLIRLQCDRHPEHYRFAETSKDIATFSECQIPCDQELACGHLCIQPCHDPSLHELMPCTWPCSRELWCDHACKALCGEPCPPCDKLVNRELQACGHNVLITCSGDLMPCDHFEGYLDLNCGKHSVGYCCGDDRPSMICEERCNEHLSCGHRCPGICGQCVVDAKHMVCTARCDILLSCSHKCDDICHSGTACPTCTQICEPMCQHDLGAHKCSEAVPPCLEGVKVFDSAGHEHEVACAFASPNVSFLELRSPEPIVSVLKPALQLIRQQLSDAAEIVEKSNRMLSQTSTLFLMQALQEGALAAGKNIQHLLQRQDHATSDAQQTIAKIKKMLQVLVDGVWLTTPEHRITAIDLDTSVYAELDKLELQAAEGRADDIVATAEYLLSLPDVSKQMRRAACGLLAATKVELELLLERTGYRWDDEDGTIGEGRRYDCETRLEQIGVKLARLNE